jgi:hypothetical protein
MKEYLLDRIRIVKSGCWIWTGTLWNGRGAKYNYGQAWNGHKRLRAHRVSYEQFVGPITQGMNVLHKCDHRLCINPDHLYLGDQEQNVKDFHQRTPALELKKYNQRRADSRVAFYDNLSPRQRKEYFKKLEAKTWKTRRKRYGKNGKKNGRQRHEEVVESSGDRSPS